MPTGVDKDSVVVILSIEYLETHFSDNSLSDAFNQIAFDIMSRPSAEPMLHASQLDMYDC
jgi:hypothetical protein